MKLKGYNLVISHGYYRDLILYFDLLQMPLIESVIRTISGHIVEGQDVAKFAIMPVYEETEEAEEAEDEAESDNQVD